MGFAILALTGFKALLRLVDHIDAALAAHNLAVAVPQLQRAKRVFDLHGSSPCRGARAPEFLCPKWDDDALAGDGGRYRDRTCGHYDVNVVLYR